jgi:hypothetical protein
VYGLFGLDCEHGCRSEYHPAYAVAIQLNGAPDKNTWAIFARNWGDEGFCSHLDHQFDLGNQVMKLLLPFNSANPPIAVTIQEAASSEIDPAASNPQTQNEWCPTFSFSPNQGEVIGIPLPSASEQALTEVVVQFAWPDGTSPLPSINIEPAAVLSMLQTRAQPSVAIPPEESAEEHLGRLFQAFHGNAMTGQQFSPMVLHQYLTRTPSAAQTSSQLGIYSRKNNLINCSAPITTGLTPSHPRAAVKAVKTKARRKTDEAKAAWDKATISEICTEYEKAGRKLPPGEPANTAQKLETLCADKRLEQ